MDAKPHYFKIGVFVLVAVGLIVVAIVLFGAGLFAQDRVYMESYFSESITGLSVGSPTEFRGVRIGQVEQIGFVGSDYDLKRDSEASVRYAWCVRVVIAVPRAKLPDLGRQEVRTVLEPMIQRGLRVRVSSNILTGQAFLEMNYLDPARFPPQPVPWVPKYTWIPSAPGELTTIKDSIDKVLGQLQAIDTKGLSESLERVFTSLNTAITEAHLAELSKEARGLLQVGREKVEALEMDKINAGAQQFVASLNQAVAEANVPALSQQVRDLLARADQKVAAVEAEKLNADLERLLAALTRAVADANVPALSGQAGSFLVELRATNQHLQRLFAPAPGGPRLTNVPEVLTRLNETLAHFDALIATERPSIERVLNDLRAITESLRVLAATLEQNPSELLFGRPPKKPGVVK